MDMLFTKLYCSTLDFQKNFFKYSDNITMFFANISVQ